MEIITVNYNPIGIKVDVNVTTLVSPVYSLTLIAHSVVWYVIVQFYMNNFMHDVNLELLNVILLYAIVQFYMNPFKHDVNSEQLNDIFAISLQPISRMLLRAMI